MRVTRRGFIKRVLTAAALVLVPSLPRLPQISSIAPKSYADAVWATGPVAYWPLREIVPVIHVDIINGAIVERVLTYSEGMKQFIDGQEYDNAQKNGA